MPYFEEWLHKNISALCENFFEETFSKMRGQEIELASRISEAEENRKVEERNRVERDEEFRLKETSQQKTQKRIDKRISRLEDDETELEEKTRRSDLKLEQNDKKLQEGEKKIEEIRKRKVEQPANFTGLRKKRKA